MLARLTDFTTIIPVKNTGRQLGPRDGSLEGAPLSASRAHILETLREEGSALSLAQLAEMTGLHPNTLRGHLDELVSAGTVRRTRAPVEGRGRPAWLYVADGPDPAPGSEYAGLAAALAIGLERTSVAPRAAAEAAGWEWGRDLAGQTPDETDSRRRVRLVLERLGFAPRDDRQATVRLTRCPLLQTARAHPEVVCGVHLGIVQGVLAESGADPGTAALHPFAEPGACVLTLHRDKEQGQ